MRDAAVQGTYKVQALDRAFAVLDLLGESETPLGLAQVAASLQLHKSTAHRFLMVLERHRMVERTTGGKGLSRHSSVVSSSPRPFTSMLPPSSTRPGSHARSFNAAASVAGMAASLV